MERLAGSGDSEFKLGRTLRGKMSGLVFPKTIGETKNRRTISGENAPVFLLS